MVANTLNLQKGTVLHFLTFDSLKKFQDEMIFFYFRMIGQLKIFQKIYIFRIFNFITHCTLLSSIFMILTQ